MNKSTFCLILIFFIISILLWLVGCMKNKETVSEVKLEMVLIEGGTFEMGGNQEGTMDKPVHKVDVSSFYMSKYEVTNKEYKKYKPSHSGYWSNDDYPVETVSWYDAVDYCNWRSVKEGFEKCYSGGGYSTVLDISKNGYRLPTEAEWEYACRAGTTTKYYWGDDMDGNYCWHKSNSWNKIHPIGQKKPNGFDLYDMSGNVSEWCWDWCDYYEEKSVNNPVGPSTGTTRVFRGGSWFCSLISCESEVRSSTFPTETDDYIGFRVVRSAP